MTKKTEKRAARVLRGERLLIRWKDGSPLWRDGSLEEFRRFIAQDRMRDGWKDCSRQYVSDMLLAIRDREVKS